jgi:predicted AlkP superfamily phosphohydrolase/phosphomutase
MYTIQQIKDLKNKVIIGISNEKEWEFMKKKGFNMTTRYYNASYYSPNTATYGGSGSSLDNIPSIYENRTKIMFSEIDFEETIIPLIFN